MLHRRSLNFCSCTDWCLDSGDSVIINRAWLYKEPKDSVLQANVNLVQKGECWTWNQWFWEAWVLFQLGVIFFTGFFCFHAFRKNSNTRLLSSWTCGVFKFFRCLIKSKDCVVSAIYSFMMDHIQISSHFLHCLLQQIFWVGESMMCNSNMSTKLKIYLQAAAFASGKTKNPNVRAGSLIPWDADCCTGTNCGRVWSSIIFSVLPFNAVYLTRQLFCIISLSQYRFM